VYVTRGTLALATSEAELAAVMAHEIGHVTARHSAERYGQTIAAKIASVGLGVLLGSGQVAQAADSVSTLIVRGYSRDQESEADLLGVRYLARVGYDPIAMAGFLERLQAHSRLEAELRGKPDAADDFSLLQTHPRTADRIVLASEQAGVTEVRDPMTRRDVYLRNLDGMVYGDDPEQGFVRGQDFLHPKLGFAFEVPDGFTLINGANQVTAVGPEGSAILFDRAPGKEAANAGSMQAYLTQQWGRQLKLSNVEAIDINGMEAATATTRVNTNSGERDLRLVTIRYDGNSVYRFLFVTPPNLTAGLSEGLKRTTYSFRKLGADEAATLKPLRLRIHEVKAGETQESLANQMAGEARPLDRFRVLNGFEPDTRLAPGTLVKLVKE
ncbi:MAG: M48 family metalloprotease, partial [Kiloniellales bacterium]